MASRSASRILLCPGLTVHRSHALRPHVFDSLEELIGVEDPRQRIQLPHHIIAFRRVVLVLDIHRFVEAPAGWPPNGAIRSNVFVSTRAPSCQRLWQLKSRPGRYSDSVNEVARTPCTRSQ